MYLLSEDILLIGSHEVRGSILPKDIIYSRILRSYTHLPICHIYSILNKHIGDIVVNETLIDNPESIDLEALQRGDKVVLKSGESGYSYSIEVIVATISDDVVMGYVDAIVDDNTSENLNTGGNIVDSLLGDELTFSISKIHKFIKTS